MTSQRSAGTCISHSPNLPLRCLRPSPRPPTALLQGRPSRLSMLDAIVTCGLSAQHPGDEGPRTLPHEASLPPGLGAARRLRDGKVILTCPDLSADAPPALVLGNGEANRRMHPPLHAALGGERGQVCGWKLVFDMERRAPNHGVKAARCGQVMLDRACPDSGTTEHAAPLWRLHTMYPWRTYGMGRKRPLGLQRID